MNLVKLSLITALLFFFFDYTERIVKKIFCNRRQLKNLRRAIDATYLDRRNLSR